MVSLGHNESNILHADLVFNSLLFYKCELISWIDSLSTSRKIGLSYVPQNPIDDKTAWIQVKKKLKKTTNGRSGPGWLFDSCTAHHGAVQPLSRSGAPCILNCQITATTRSLRCITQISLLNLAFTFALSYTGEVTVFMVTPFTVSISICGDVELLSIGGIAPLPPTFAHTTRFAEYRMCAPSASQLTQTVHTYWPIPAQTNFHCATTLSCHYIQYSALEPCSCPGCYIYTYMAPNTPTILPYSTFLKPTFMWFMVGAGVIGRPFLSFLDGTPHKQAW